MRAPSPQQGFILRLLLAAFLILFICAGAVRAWVLAPSDFPTATTFVIQKGESLGAVAYRLQQARYIRSAEAFKLVMFALGKEGHIAVGQYYFDAPLTMIKVALKLSGKDFGVLQQRVTFPEGFTNTDMARRLAAQFPGFDGVTFLAKAKAQQGYLFPDTYSFVPDVTPESVIASLTANFATKTAPLQPYIDASSHSQKDIITMASIIEKEANGAEEAAVIAGILWKRIQLGIALQVDAPFYYLLGKTSAQLTVKDLAIDSPYNTYKYRGLPPTPINNPGLVAITAAVRPVDSPYLYYLHDSQGVVHYASTLAEHNANKARYLP